MYQATTGDVQLKGCAFSESECDLGWTGLTLTKT